jgi:hypothetical protein
VLRRFRHPRIYAQAGPCQSHSNTDGYRFVSRRVQDFFRDFFAHPQDGAPIVGINEVAVLDLVFVGVSILFFVVSIGYVAACDRLMK